MNPRPPAYEADALPIELHRHKIGYSVDIVPEPAAERMSCELRRGGRSSADSLGWPFRSGRRVAAHADHDIDTHLLRAGGQIRVHAELHRFRRDIDELTGIDVVEVVMALDA